jgi:hypothetical protein
LTDHESFTAAVVDDFVQQLQPRFVQGVLAVLHGGMRRPRRWLAGCTSVRELDARPVYDGGLDGPCSRWMAALLGGSPGAAGAIEGRAGWLNSRLK